MTIQEHFGRLDGIKLCFIGVHNNVCNSLIAAGMKVGVEVTVVAPEVNPAAVDKELWNEASGKGLYKTLDTDTTTIGNSLEKVIAESDVVYTDTWVDMEFFTDPAFEKERKRPVGEDDAVSIEHRTAKGTRVPSYALSPRASRV